MVATAPDYAKWCDRRVWTVHDAVCLMLALEPDTARHDPSASIGGFDPVELAIEQYGEHADEAMRTGALQPFSREDLARPALQRRVDPHAFLRCAKTWDVRIPDELATGLARKSPRPPVVPSTTLEQLGRGYLGADYIEEAREQVLGAALAASITGAKAQNYPTRPIHLIAPYSAGGIADIAARLRAVFETAAGADP